MNILVITADINAISDTCHKQIKLYDVSILYNQSLFNL